MNLLLQEIQSLIQNSFALQRDTLEQTFWTDQSKTLSEEQLIKLKDLLLKESFLKAQIEKII